MPKISSYPLITTVTDQDLFVISDSSNNDATKSLELETLKTYINEGVEGSGTVTSVNLTAGALIDVSGGPITTSGSITVSVDLSELADMTDPMISTDEFVVLDSGVQKRKEASEIGLSIFNNDSGYTTNLGVVQTLTTAGTSGAATLVGGTLNIPQYSGGGGGDTYDLNAGTKSGNSVPLNLTSGSGTDNSVVNLTEGSNITLTQTSATEITIDSASPTGSQLYKTTFTGNTLVNAFNGNLSDKIVLVSVPAGKIAIVENALFIIKAGSTGTTNYNADNVLHVLPEGAISSWGPRFLITALNASSDYVLYSLDAGTGSSISQYGGVGADIILGPPSSGGAVDITQGDRDVVISVVYRIVDF